MTRKHIFLSDDKWELIFNIKEEKYLDSLGAVIEFLLENYSTEQSIYRQSQLIATELAEQQKEFFDILRVRTSFMDKHLKIILNIMNDTLIHKGLDMDDQFEIATYNKNPSVIFKKSKEKVEDEIRYFREQKLMRNNNEGQSDD